MRLAHQARLMRWLRSIAPLAVGVVVVAAAAAGCKDRSPATQRVPVPPPQPAPRIERDPIKPLPDQSPQSNLPAPPFDDAPLVNQRPPEEPAFIDAYNRVGRPRIVVLSRSDTANGRAIEDALADILGCNGQVLLTSPTQARQQNGGGAAAVHDLAERLNADVLVEAQEHATQQGPDAARTIRVIVEALNTRGGQSLGRAFIDIPTPLDEPRIRHASRDVARKLMDDMTAAWNAPPPPELRRDNPRESTTPTPTPTAPAPAPAPGGAPSVPQPDPPASSPASAPST